MINFRDLGGYRTAAGRTVRWRRLFRSGALHHMSDADVERARGLGIRSILDLRRPDEVERLGLGPFAVPPVRRHTLPLIPEGGSSLLDRRYGRGISADRYLGYLAFDAGPFVAAIELLAEESTYPAVFHCTAGKDRTAVIAAFVLDLLGVDTPTIEADYALSNLAADALADHLRRDFELMKRGGSLPEGAPSPQLPADYRPVPPGAISEFLERVRRDFGSSRGYFEAQGVEPSTLDRLAELLLE